MGHICKDCDMIAHTCDIYVTRDIQFTLDMLLSMEYMRHICSFGKG